MMRCLIVDDSEAMREIAGDHLRALGHRADEATSAADAVAAMEQTPGRYDVVLLDWDLPSLGALDVLRAAAAMDARPAIVLCATEHDTRQLSLAAAAGAPHHVLKPFDRTALACVLDRLSGSEAA